MNKWEHRKNLKDGRKQELKEGNKDRRKEVWMAGLINGKKEGTNKRKEGKKLVMMNGRIKKKEKKRSKDGWKDK